MAGALERCPLGPVGSGSREHDFDGASMIVFCMSAIEHVENSSNTAAVDFREDRTVLPFVAYRTVATFSSKKNLAIVVQMDM